MQIARTTRWLVPPLLAAPLYALLVRAHPLTDPSGPAPPAAAEWLLPALLAAALFAGLAGLGGRGRSGEPPQRSGSLAGAALVGGLALGIRALLLLDVGDVPLAGDEKFYWRTALAYAHGEVNPLGVFFGSVVRPPMWGLLLSSAAAGEEVATGRVLALVLGAANPVLVYLLAARLFDRRTGLVAGLLYALLPEHALFSHFLFAENLFGFLLLLSLLLFAVFAADPRRRRFLYASAAVGGVCLLTKEFTVIPLAAFFVATLLLPFERKRRAVVLAGLLAVAPAAGHSVMASLIKKRPIVLSTASVANLQQGAGLDLQIGEPLGAATGRLGEALARRSPADTLANAGVQLHRLWGPNSYPITRLRGVHDPESWSYDVAAPWGPAHFAAATWLLTAVAAVLGLCLARPSPFWGFSVYCLLALSATSLVAFLASRFRLPFLFPLVIYAAHFLTSGDVLLVRLRQPARALAVAALLAFLAHAVATTAPRFGTWG